MEKVISKDGTVIAFDCVGSGPPLILVDGALCYRGSGPMVPLAALLASHFTVFTYDRRGRGDSGDTAPYAVEREVEDIDALIKEAGGLAFVYGISSGAGLALEAANRARRQEAGLVRSPVHRRRHSSPVPADVVQQLERLVAADCRSDAVRLFMKLVGVPAVFVGLMCFMPAWSKLKGVAHTLPYDLTIVSENQRGRPLPLTRWTSTTVPTLVVAGGKSPAWMRNAMQALARVLPSAKHYTLEGQTHMVSAKALAPVLAEFFGRS